MKKHIIKKAIKHALKSNCRFKVSALGFNKKGELIHLSFNKSRFSRYGGGIHAEEDLIKRGSRSVKYILICRVNKNGSLLPIEPCKKCRKIAKKYNIKIESISETESWI